MSDATPEPDAFAAAGDDELVFEDVAPVAPVRKSRRAPAKGDAATELPPSAAPDRAAAEEPVDPPAPVPQPGDASTGSASSEPARDRRQVLLLAIVGLALFTSLMSLGGLIAVSRTLAAAQAQRAQALSERDTLAKLPETIATLDRASAALAAAAGRAGTPVAAAPGAVARPLTADDLNHALDALRLALANRQPTGVDALGGTLHSGFDEIAARLDRIDAALAHPAPARPAASR